jgi:hypothetical protein
MKNSYAQRIRNAEEALNILANIREEYYDSIRNAYLKATAAKLSRPTLAIKLEELRDQASRLLFPNGQA